MKKLRTMLIGFCVFGYGIATQAQEAVSATGGNASGSGGTASYTVGQVAYTTNSSASGTITQGVQQPYEILVATGIAEAKGISLECIVYPNPTNDLVKLKIENYNLENLSYELYDINGKLLQDNKTEGTETIISMANLAPATYFLKVTDNTKEVKVFKIIKN
jgi:hypothetical protein